MIDFNLQDIEDVTNSGEYQLLLAKRYSELKKRKFKKHVEINISYTSKCQIRSDYLAIQCEYENENNEIITASVPYFDKRPYDVSENELPDIYFSMSSNNIVIFTKHFSTLNIGLVEAKKNFVTSNGMSNNFCLHKIIAACTHCRCLFRKER